MSTVVNYVVLDDEKAQKAMEALIDSDLADIQGNEEEAFEDFVMELPLNEGDKISAESLKFSMMRPYLAAGTVMTKLAADSSTDDRWIWEFLQKVLLPDLPVKEYYGFTSYMTTEVFIQLFEAIPKGNLREAMDRENFREQDRVRVHNFLFDLRPIAKTLKENVGRYRLVVDEEGDFLESECMRHVEKLYQRLLEKHPELRGRIT